MTESPDCYFVIEVQRFSLSFVSQSLFGFGWAFMLANSRLYVKPWFIYSSQGWELDVYDSLQRVFFCFCCIPTSIGRRVSGVTYSAERYLTPAYFSIFPFSLPLSIASLCHRVAKMKICKKSAGVTNDRGLELLFCIGVQQISLSFVS